MNEQKKLQSKLAVASQEIKLKAADEIQKNGFSHSAAVLLALNELIKEQNPNENISTSTR